MADNKKEHIIGKKQKQPSHNTISPPLFYPVGNLLKIVSGMILL